MKKDIALPLDLTSRPSRKWFALQALFLGLISLSISISIIALACTPNTGSIVQGGLFHHGREGHFATFGPVIVDKWPKPGNLLTNKLQGLYEKAYEYERKYHPVKSCTCTDKGHEKLSHKMMGLKRDSVLTGLDEVFMAPPLTRNPEEKQRLVPPNPKEGDRVEIFIDVRIAVKWSDYSDVSMGSGSGSGSSTAGGLTPEPQDTRDGMSLPRR